MLCYRLKDCLGQVMVLQQMADLQEGALFRDSIFTQTNTGKAAHGFRIDQRFFGARVEQTVELLLALDAQRDGQRRRRATPNGPWAAGSAPTDRARD